MAHEVPAATTPYLFGFIQELLDLILSNIFQPGGNRLFYYPGGMGLGNGNDPDFGGIPACPSGSFSDPVPNTFQVLFKRHLSHLLIESYIPCSSSVQPNNCFISSSLILHFRNCY
jgi:hypothetical protein